MRTYQLSKRVFTKNPFLMGSLLLAFIGLSGYIAYWQIRFYPAIASSTSLAYDSTLLLGFALRACPIYFVLCTFLSFEYCTKTKSSGLLECLRAEEHAAGRLFALQLRFLVMLNGIFTLLLVCEYWLYLTATAGWDTAVFLHILLNFFLNYFLIGLTGILLGGACALYLKRLTAYLLLVLFVFLSSTMLDSMIYQLSSIQRVSLYWLHDFFFLFPPATDWDVDGLLGYSLLPYRWALLGFWGLLAGSLLLFHFYKEQKRRTRPVAILSAALCAVCLTVYFLPAS